jgi:CRISPR-associated protein Cst1
MQWGENYRMPSLTAYHFSNNGTSARVTLYPLPSSTVQFVWEANKDQHKAIWQRIVSLGWSEDKAESEELQSKTPKLTQRNLIYEHLFELPENARDFLRTYFLRRPLRTFKRDLALNTICLPKLI